MSDERTYQMTYKTMSGARVVAAVPTTITHPRRGLVRFTAPASALSITAHEYPPTITVHGDSHSSVYTFARPALLTVQPNPAPVSITYSTTLQRGQTDWLATLTLTFGEVPA